MDTDTLIELLLNANAAICYGTNISAIVQSAYANLSMRTHKSKQQLKSLQVAQANRRVKRPINPTFGGFNDALHHWASAHQESVVIIQGTSQSEPSIKSLEVRAAELLGEMHVPVAWALDWPPNSAEVRKQTSMAQRNIVAQLCLQILLCNEKLHERDLLRLMLRKCQDATTDMNWLEILEHCLDGLDAMTFVMDLDAIDTWTADSISWPTFFDSLPEALALKGTSCALRAILFTCKPASTFCSVPGIRVNKLLQAGDRGLNQRSQPFTLESCFNQSVGPSLQSVNRRKRKGSESNEGIGSNKKARNHASLPHTSQMHGKPDPSCTPVHQAFEIALMCALTHEADAVEALFDRHWENTHVKVPGDTNTYSTGKLGSHNVVLVYMPGMGTNAAATVATRCRETFPNIRLVILVGVCGGVPFEPNGQEVVLGDIIFGDSVIQYDFGRRLPGQFQRKENLMESLGRPCMELRSLIARLRGHRGVDCLEKKTASYLEQLSREAKLAAKYPGKSLDVLYAATYSHANQGLTCDEAGCDGERIQRNRLTSTTDPSPAIHFGCIASGNAVIKSGEERDALAQSASVIAFEMESAGIWDVLPCIVIKGVCDYADSHKHKQWQRYAAATAACCAKAFIEQWGY